MRKKSKEIFCFETNEQKKNIWPWHKVKRPDPVQILVYFSFVWMKQRDSFNIKHKHHTKNREREQKSKYSRQQGWGLSNRVS